MGSIYRLPIVQTDNGGLLAGGISKSNVLGNKTQPSLGSYVYCVIKFEDPSCYLDVLGLPNDLFCSNDGSIDLLVTGEGEPFTYDWTYGATTEYLHVVPDASYTVAVLNDISSNTQTYFIK